MMLSNTEQPTFTMSSAAFAGASLQLFYHCDARHMMRHMIIYIY